MPPSKRLNAKDFPNRREYQKLLQHVSAAGTDGELSTEARDNLISDNLHRAEALFEAFSKKSEGSAPEMAMDASVFRHIAHDIKNRVQGININDTAFKYSEFATKVAGLMNTEKDDSTKTFKTVPLRWQALGANSARKFRRVPCLAYLYGSVGDEREEEAKAAKIARVRTPPAKKTSTLARKGSATRVVRRKAAEVEDDDDTMVKKMVKSLHEDFCREFKNNRQKPINFYEFVCDPTSFANTVENIFHVSFLIKDRKVALVDSEESSLPELIPINMTGNSGHIANSDLGTEQRIVSLDMRQWRQFVRIFGMKEPMVKRKSNNGVVDDNGDDDDEGGGGSDE